MNLLKLSAVLGVAMLLCHCGLSPEQACKEVVTTTCSKLIECTSEANKKLLPFLKDQSTCEAKFTTDSKCSDPNPCGDGKTYSPTKAAACVNEYKALACADLLKNQSNEKSPSCNQVCQ